MKVFLFKRWCRLDFFRFDMDYEWIWCHSAFVCFMIVGFPSFGCCSSILTHYFVSLSLTEPNRTFLSPNLSLSHRTSLYTNKDNSEVIKQLQNELKSQRDIVQRFSDMELTPFKLQSSDKGSKKLQTKDKNRIRAEMGVECCLLCGTDKNVTLAHLIHDNKKIN